MARWRHSLGKKQTQVSLRGALFAPKQSPIRKVGIASPAARNDTAVTCFLVGAKRRSNLRPATEGIASLPTIARNDTSVGVIVTR